MSWKKNGRSSHYDVTLSDQTATAPFTSTSARLCLLFIHPGAPNLISLRSAGTIPA